MLDHIFTVLAGVGFLLNLFTAYVVYKSPNSPSAAFILVGWIFSWNVLHFTDSIIWSGGNAEDWWDGKIYCDIDSRIKDAICLGVPGAAIGAFRFLSITVEEHVSLKAESGRNYTDVMVGLIFPIVITVLRLIVMPARYSIFPVLGCTGIIDDSWPSILIWYIWPPILSAVATIYAGTTLSD
jgi:pheromone a factor receptor